MFTANVQAGTNDSRVRLFFPVPPTVQHYYHEPPAAAVIHSNRNTLHSRLYANCNINITARYHNIMHE